jgi:MscS family membrane protein
VDPDFFLVRFTDFGASSLDIFLYYFTKSIKWDEHLGVRERVNLNIMRSIREMGLSIAFPTRSIHLESLPPGLSLGSRPE